MIMQLIIDNKNTMVELHHLETSTHHFVIPMTS